MRRYASRYAGTQVRKYAGKHYREGVSREAGIAGTQVRWYASTQ